jgi:hypothetical protein
MAGTTALSTRVRRYLTDPVATWRTGSRESQALTLASLLVGVSLSFGLSMIEYSLMPLTAYFVWLLLGMILLRFVPLVVLCVVTVTLAFSGLLLSVPLDGPRLTAMGAMVVSVLLILFTASRQHSGLPGPMSEAMLNDLRRRLQANGKVPALPGGWTSQSAMLASSGVGYGGDFLVARLDHDETHLELILVDVCGKGVGAASQALQFGGALGGLIGALPPRDLMLTANEFMLRLEQHDSFATAVHVALDLGTGGYQLTSAGHPPALVWSAERRDWRIDNASGTALGIVPEPVLESTQGVLAPGDALMFYTDGVIEYRSTDLDVGLAWLRERAAAAVADGFDGAAQRVLAEVRRGDDDRAVLILHRALATRAHPDGHPARPSVMHRRPD